MYLFKNDQLIPLGIGKSRILGRICMEDDILADSVDLPPTVNIGDRIIIADAGAYERSMSYEFGYGRLGQSY
jgi:diaminopimelate decarboxylase